jgi:hypothetical protein
VTCYFRHLQEVFSKAGIEVTKENRKELEVIIHKIMHVEYKNCPATWKEVQKKLAEDEAGLVSRLKAEWNKHK